MVVRRINNLPPDVDGNFNIDIPMVGNPPAPLKIFTATVTTTGSDGTWSVDYTSTGFNSISSIQATCLAGSFSLANAPVGSNITTFSNTTCSGKAFKATSSGVLLAMQQLPAEPGTQINVLVIGN